MYYICSPTSCPCTFNDSYAGYSSQKACGFIMTDTCQDARRVTPDGSHFGSAVNILKAQILLATLKTKAPHHHEHNEKEVA